MKVSSGNVSADITGLDFITDLLKKVAPETKRVIDHQIQKVYEEAVNDWPVRQPKELTDVGQFSATAYDMLKNRPDWKGIKQALAVAYNLKKKNQLKLVEGFQVRSQNSKAKMTIGIKMSSTGEIIAFVGNTAEYAWAIRIGKKTDSFLPMGSRVSNELLFKPMKKASSVIAKQMADELTKT
jgi:hypothetical protein